MKAKTLDAPTESLFNLRQVIELTGVSEFTLRGWEGRYGAFAPQRTASGRRLYTTQDLRRIRALLVLTAQGHKISQICSLSLERLMDLETAPAESSAQVRSSVRTPMHSPVGRDPAVAEVIVKAKRFDWDGVEKVFQKRAKALTGENFVHQFAVQLLSEIAVQVMKEALSISQEHILSSLLKESLYSLRPDTVTRKKNKSLRVLLATPEGDFHELGILIAATLSRLQGVSFLYLGPNVPKADLCETCLRFDASHVLLASTISKSEGAKEDLLTVINFFDRQIPRHVELWTAGRTAAQLPIELKRPYVCLSSFHDFSDRLKSLARP